MASSSAKEVSLSGIGTLLRDSERPFGDADTDRQAERRELGRSPGDCHDPRSLVSRRSRPLAFRHLDERLGPGCSTGKRASPMSQCSNVHLQEYPSSFTLCASTYSRTGVQRSQDSAFCREVRGLLIPVRRLVTKGQVTRERDP